METRRTLFRDTDNRMLGGVASGLAEYMGWDMTFSWMNGKRKNLRMTVAQ